MGTHLEKRFPRDLVVSRQSIAGCHHGEQLRFLVERPIRVVRSPIGHKRESSVDRLMLSNGKDAATTLTMRLGSEVAMVNIRCLKRLGNK